MITGVEKIWSHHGCESLWGHLWCHPGGERGNPGSGEFTLLTSSWLLMFQTKTNVVFFFFFSLLWVFPPSIPGYCFVLFLFWFLLCNRFRFGGGFPPSEGSDCAGRQAPRVSLLLQQHFSFPAAQPSHFFCFGFQGTEATDIISFFLLSSFCRIGHSTMELLPPIRSWMIGWTCWSWSSGRSPAAALLCTV